jgi:hypothetical protein
VLLSNRGLIMLLATSLSRMHTRWTRARRQRCSGQRRTRSQGGLLPRYAPVVSQLIPYIRHALTTQLHFPFLTCQWKSQKSGEGHYHASLQGARDGAAIARNLYDLYQTAQHEPSIVDTTHFSLTTDTDTAKLWVHWLKAKEDGGTDHHMELISQAFLRPLTSKDTSMVDMRKMLRNILESAVSARLDSIRTAIASLPLPPPRMRSPKLRPAKKSFDTQSDPAVSLEHPFTTAPRIDAQLQTPGSLSPPLKRMRVK